MLEFFTAISLFLTPWAVLTAALVVYQWGPASIHAICHKGMNSNDWLVLGIVVGFVGAILDNLYWGYAWQLKYTNNPNSEWWFEYGVMANVLFRQGAGVIAGTCFIMSACKILQHPITLCIKTVTVIAILLCVAYSSYFMGYS